MALSKNSLCDDPEVKENMTENSLEEQDWGVHVRKGEFGIGHAKREAGRTNSVKVLESLLVSLNTLLKAVESNEKRL